MSEMLLIVHLAGRRAAIPADRVNSVIDLAEMTPVPRAPAHVSGLAALRSRPMTVIDCAASLGLPVPEGTQRHRTVVVEHDGHLYGLLVADADDIVAAVAEPTPLRNYQTFLGAHPLPEAG